MKNRIEKIMKENNIPAVAYSYKGSDGSEVVDAIGVRDLSSNTPVDTFTIFEACSLSKPVFALYTLIFLEEHGYNIDNKILDVYEKNDEVLFDRYVNNDNLSQLTFKHVLSHCSGFPNWGSWGGSVEAQIKPGKYFSYSGEAFMFMQNVMQQKTDKPIEIEIKEKVLNPLGMVSSEFVWNDGLNENLAIGHDDKNQLVNKMQWNLMAPASLHTNILDYTKFVKELVNPQSEFKKYTEVIKTQGIELNYSKKFDGVINEEMGKVYPNLYWGNGIGLEKSDLCDCYFQWGNQMGYGACVIASADERYMVFLANSQQVIELRQELANHVFGKIKAIDWLNM